MLFSKSISIAILSCVSIVLTPMTAAAETGSVAPDEIVHEVPGSASEMKIDGSLSEAAWDAALTFELAYEYAPLEKAPAIVRTQVLLTSDDSNLYVGFRCFDPEPAAIRAYLTDRDGIEGHDQIQICLDTFNDNRRSYLFAVNALGIQMDAIMTGDSESDNWDGIWSSAARITDYGYEAEMAIPFAIVRFHGGEGERVWGIDARRVYLREQDHYLGLIPRDNGNDCYQCQFVKISGFAQARLGRHLEITPSVTALSTSSPDPQSETDSVRESELSPSLNADIRISDYLTLSGTTNPDFSQVESDTLLLDINQPFALSYPEKRPFFLEGADFFDTSINAVHTRSIRDPNWGVKLAGKAGSNSIGYFTVEDEVTNLIFPGSQSSRSTTIYDSSVASALRLRHEFGRDLSLGALATDREGDDYFNRLLGLDLDYRITDSDRLSTQLIATSTKYPEETARDFDQETGDINDRGFELDYSHADRTWEWRINYLDLGSGFRSDVGFVPRVDIRDATAILTYKLYGSRDSWWRRLSFSGYYSLAEDQAGQFLNRTSYLRMTYLGKLQSNLDLRGYARREAYGGEEFDMKYLWAQFDFRPEPRAHVYLFTQIGDAIDYTDARAGMSARFNAYFSYRYGEHLYFNVWDDFERMEVGGDRLYTANVSQLAATYQFDARFFIRLKLQNADYDYNVANYLTPVSPNMRRLVSQLLFSFKLNPRTVLFLGYSGDYRGDDESGLSDRTHTLFFKVGYAFLL
jgi:hypothetical protein